MLTQNACGVPPARPVLFEDLVAFGCRSDTDSTMHDDRELQARMLPTRLFSSFVGRAQAGDLDDADQRRRSAAWAHWAVSSLVEMKGVSDRPYVALALPGRFHDPNGRAPVVRPHLELPQWIVDRPDPEFCDRLAQAGNGLLFPWWLPSEVVAVRRALFNRPSGPVTDLVDVVCERADVLRDAVRNLLNRAAPRWSIVESLLVESNGAALADAAASDFDTATIAEFFAPAADLELTVTFDAKLVERNARSVARRVGVWQIRGVSGDGVPFGLGVISPRLTANSQFNDPLFRVDTESPAALLVRGLVLQRLIRTHIDPALRAHVADIAPTQRQPGPHLRAIVAQVGAKIPEASVDAAVHFLQTYPDPDVAWSELDDWATRTRAVLTVADEAFRRAHRNATRALRRAEDPDRDDLNVVMPLAWNDDSRVVRVTFSRPPVEQA